MIEFVIFDLDGVLVDSEILSARALQAEAREFGLSLGIDHILSHYTGLSYPRVHAAIERQFSTTLPTNFEASYRARLRSAFARELAPMEGARECISCLGIPFCIATSSAPERAHHSLSITGLAGLFGNRVYTASEVARAKPAPDLFLHAAKKMRSAPEKTLVIEDSIAGVEAALAAKMKCGRFMGGSHLRGVVDQSRADFTFDNFPALFDHYPELMIESKAKTHAAR